MTPEPGWPAAGRLIGVDVGTVRVGLAVCDPDRLVASPVGTYVRRTPDLDAAYFAALAASESAVGFVLGLPIRLDGTEGPKAVEHRAFGAWLTAATGLPCRYWDERYTSALADDALIAAGVARHKRKAKRDHIAAVLILQAYLDAGSPA